MSKIMVFPGTVWQVPIMNKIKAMGHEVFLVNPVWHEGVAEHADHFFQSDIFDYESIVEYCKQENIDVVLSDECDIATNAVVKINNEIGAISLSEYMARLFTDKFEMRRFCEENDFCPIPYCLCEELNEAVSFYVDYGPKVVMKPIDSNASHGVFTITSEKELFCRFEESLSFSRNKKAVLLEQFIGGTEFTVDGVMTKAGHITLAISEKEHYAHNENIANSLYFRNYSDKFDYDLLRKTNDELLNATGLPFGLTHVEYKYYEGKYYLIEMAARGGGNLISAIIAPFMSGVDNYNYLINCYLNKDFEEPIFVTYDSNKTAILKFMDIPCDTGIIREIQGEAYLRDESCIKAYGLNFKPGDKVTKPENDSVRIGYYIICADSKEEFDQIEENVRSKFCIVIG